MILWLFQIYVFYVEKREEQIVLLLAPNFGAELRLFRINKQTRKCQFALCFCQRKTHVWNWRAVFWINDWLGVVPNKQIDAFNTPLNLCSVCGGLGLACLGIFHIRHAFRGCVINKSDNAHENYMGDLDLTTLPLGPVAEDLHWLM